MERITISKETTFIGCWNINDDNLCNNIIEIFEKNKALVEIKDEIENELYTLSKAHYEKYFVEPLKRKKSK